MLSLFLSIKYKIRAGFILKVKLSAFYLYLNITNKLFMFVLDPKKQRGYLLKIKPLSNKTIHKTLFPYQLNFKKLENLSNKEYKTGFGFIQ